MVPTPPSLFLRHLLPSFSSLHCYHLGCLHDRCCKLHCSSPDDVVTHGVVQSAAQPPRALAGFHAPG